MRLRLPRTFTKTLSGRLSLMAVGEIALLLLSSLAVMFLYARHLLREEATLDARQALDGVVEHIDNILLSIEQTSGNIYWSIAAHAGDSLFMEACCTRIKECNPYVAQVRYTSAMTVEFPMWTVPAKKDGDESTAFITFCLPLYTADGKPSGVIAADLDIRLLSDIAHEAKPSPRSYITLFSREGSYIVHPNREKLFSKSVFDLLSSDDDPTAREAAEAMVSGGTGLHTFSLDGEQWCVFYKPFPCIEVPGRFIYELGWSVGVIYPDSDIFGEYNRLLWFVLAVALVGLLLFYVLCRFVAHRQLVDLRQLTSWTEAIASGRYNAAIPITRREDEIGLLQQNFQQMQLSLSAHMDELRQRMATLQERGEVLRRAHQQAREADRMKTAFLQHTTNQMMAPSEAIEAGVATLCREQRNLSGAEAARIVEVIHSESQVIVDLLDHLIYTAADDTADKEDDKP